MKATKAPTGQLPLWDKPVPTAVAEPLPPRDCAKCGGLIVMRRIMSDVEYHCLQCGCPWRPPAPPVKADPNPLAGEARKLAAKRKRKLQRRLIEQPRRRVRHRKAA